MHERRCVRRRPRKAARSSSRALPQGCRWRSWLGTALPQGCSARCTAAPPVSAPPAAARHTPFGWRRFAEQTRPSPRCRSSPLDATPRAPFSRRPVQPAHRSPPNIILSHPAPRPLLPGGRCLPPCGRFCAAACMEPDSSMFPSPLPGPAEAQSRSPSCSHRLLYMPP